MKIMISTVMLAAGLAVAAMLPVQAGERGVEVLKTGTDYAEARLGHGEAVIKVRYARINGVRRWQVQMPSGGWRNCGHSCSEYYRCNVLEPWVCRMEDANGDYDN